MKKFLKLMIAATFLLAGNKTYCMEVPAPLPPVSKIAQVSDKLQQASVFLKDGVEKEAKKVMVFFDSHSDLKAVVLHLISYGFALDVVRSNGELNKVGDFFGKDFFKLVLKVYGLSLLVRLSFFSFKKLKKFSNIQEDG